MNLPTKSIRGHLHVVFSKKTIDEINKPVIALLYEVLTTLRTMDVGGNSNVNNSFFIYLCFLIIFTKLN